MIDPRAVSSRPDPIVVVHAVASWLPQTCTWIDTQVRHLPGRVESHIACERRLNLDQFDLPRIHAYQEHPGRYLGDRVLRRLRLRTHMGALVSTIRETRARVLHSHFGNLGWANARVAERAGLKHVVTFYGYDVNMLPRSEPRWRARYEELFARVDRVLCEGPFMARAVEDLGCPRGKIRVHHLGVDLARIPFVPRVYRSGDRLRVYIAGSFREKKGIPLALEVLAGLQDRIPLEVTIVGDAPADHRGAEEKGRILDLVSRFGLGGRVRFLGMLPYAAYLDEAARHHVFLSPSLTAADGDTEGGAPVSLIEMCASGMPVVSTRHCDIPEVVLPGITGLLAPEKDAEGLARHLRWLVDHPDRWSELTRRARRRVESEFNAAVQGRRLADLYAEVLG